MQSKSPLAFRTISEVTELLNVPQHVLRFWESKFTQIKPMKRGGRRRYYRPEDLLVLERIRDLLYTDGYTIKGVQNILKKEINETNVIKRDFSHKERAELNSIILDLEEIRGLLV